MFTINTNEISMMNINNANTTPTSVNWLQHTNVNDSVELSNKYAHICQQHKQDKKWVLFINPEESSIEQLAKLHNIDVSKVLMVNYKDTAKAQVKVELSQIKSVLSKGNCSAVILSNTCLGNEEISELEDAAVAGKTHCIVIEKNTLH